MTVLARAVGRGNVRGLNAPRSCQSVLWDSERTITALARKIAIEDVASSDIASDKYCGGVYFEPV
jgi:hypothetical protein